MPRSTGPVDRAFPRARPLQSVDRGQSTAPSCAHSCTPVDRAVDRPPPPVDRAVDREHNSVLLNAPFLAPLSSDLCASSFHLLYLLSPTKTSHLKFHFFCFSLFAARDPLRPYVIRWGFEPMTSRRQASGLTRWPTVKLFC